MLVLGVAYKKDIDDMRESPALDVMRLLEEQGAKVVYHDPSRARRSARTARAAQRRAHDEALARADAVVIVTDHSRGRLPAWWSISSRVVVDTRNATAGLTKWRASAAGRSSA